jgi:hypothetical protein
MRSLGPETAIMTRYPENEQIRKSFCAYENVVEKREYQERNEPLRSGSPIQACSHSHFEERGKVAHETVE